MKFRIQAIIYLHSFDIPSSAYFIYSKITNHDENGYAVETFCKIVVLSTDPR